MSSKKSLTQNARVVLEKRYLRRDESGRVTETPDQLFERVAMAVAQPEGRNRQVWTERFHELMIQRRFMPNSPTLMNAGRPKGQLSACFVLPVGDSLDEIFDTLKHAAKIHQSGGGTGFSFSRLRPKGSLVRTTHGVASGPVSFIRIFDVATDTIKQGGARRGANMAILRVDHPDILDFIRSKRDQKSILNFNISVGVTDEFMRALAQNDEFWLKDPRTQKRVKAVQTQEIFDEIVQAAWECGDPGLVFLDRINLFNPTPNEGLMESTNPCVTGDTRVLVEGRGFVPICELVGEQPRISTEENGHVGFRPATRVIRTGTRPVFRLRTFEGYELRLTEDHRVMTARGDICAKDLEPGDRVRLYECLPEKLRRVGKDVALGEIVGWLVGDGHFTQHEQDQLTAVLSFYGQDKLEAAPKMLSAVREFLGDGSIGLNRVDARDLTYIRSQRLHAGLAELGVGESCKKRVPEMVWRGSRELVSGFLRGLFSSDGSVQGTIDRGASIRLASNQPGLLKDIQILLLRLGMKSVLYRERRVAGKRMIPDGRGGLCEYDCVAQHELVLSKTALMVFAQSVGFLVGAKEERLKTLLSGYHRGPDREDFYATVDELMLEGEEDVFDLTEPVTSHFHAGGLLVHNCGEQPLLPYESCNLGSLNLGEYVRDRDFDWDLFRNDIHTAVRFLDNVVEINCYPVAECGRITLRNRKVGLGIMGLADYLLLVGIPYASAEAQRRGEEIMAFLDREAKKCSAELANKKGAFPNWPKSIWKRLGYPPLRNATVSTIAPTGTISIIAGASSGIEPIFSGIFFRNVLAGERLVEIHPAVERVFAARGLSLRGVGDEEISAKLGAAWSPAQRIPVEAHVEMQAVFQRHSDSSVSKTINLPEHALPGDVGRAYRLAYELGCKGITVYRDRSRSEQVLEKARSEEALVEAFCPSC